MKHSLKRRQVINMGFVYVKTNINGDEVFKNGHTNLFLNEKEVFVIMGKDLSHKRYLKKPINEPNIVSKIVDFMITPYLNPDCDRIR